MIIQEFTMASMPDLMYLHKTQDIDASFLTPESLPAIGYITFIDGVPAAAGFLRKVEGGFGQLDTLVTNKRLPPDIRHEAIGGIVGKLIETSKHLELKGIISFTTDEGIVKRALSIGFQASPQFVLTLPFT